LAGDWLRVPKFIFDIVAEHGVYEKFLIAVTQVSNVSYWYGRRG